MSKNFSIVPASLIQLESIKVGKLYKMEDNLIKGDIMHKDQQFFIKGPKMFLGSPISKTNGYYYIDLTFDQKSANRKFLRCINDIDSVIIHDIHEQQKEWYTSGQNIDVLQIEQEFISSNKKSSIYDERQSIKIKIPHDKIEFYDQDNVVVPYQLIKENFQVVPLLHLTSVCKDKFHIWLEWSLPQLKVELPSNLLTGCQLVDINDSDSDSDAIPNEGFDS
jgi:hypothetical protein